ncbi:hypothetical protein CCL15_02050 [Pseudomonas syringae]|uniref:hypothetical protein n=1 Tax=Pseudomonas syringae TaxID=317 RepID=UPI000BB5D651|nr:hypothetical protein [Pseudomonas syringae]PBP76158.1 hypothetical protein CCL15_02050 [Pseudomonas syringae]
MKKPIRRTNNTILIAVEGYTEEAFLRHLKQIYCGRDSFVSMTVKNAKGKGPDGIVAAIKSATRTGDYNLIGAVFDGDVPISVEVERWLKANRVATFVSTPSIEATLLAVKTCKPGRTTKECKDLLTATLSGEATDESFYGKHFPEAVIERGRMSASCLNDLIIFITRKS